MAELLPCPFCGKLVYIPRCTSTTCIGRSTKPFETKQVAIDLWNTRTPIEREVSE